MDRGRLRIELLRHPIGLLPLVLGASSIASLLLYFFGVMEMNSAVRLLLLPAAILLAALTIWARQTGRAFLYTRILAGLWAGSVATLAYDVVRVPIALSGIPVFKAISYFGTVLTAQSAATAVSELAGWTYHLSNGVGFGLMYTFLVARPRWWTAVLWGLALEAAMLSTPYAEVFGYRVSPRFLAITIGSHAVYGLTLWAALRYWTTARVVEAPSRSARWAVSLTWALVPFVMSVVATDFHFRYAKTAAPSPPPYLGPELYTTWDVLEPDRLVSLWILRRFVDPDARFHFVPPFSNIEYGKAFDIPEAEIRRSGGRSATEVLIAESGLSDDDRLSVLSRVAHQYEITPWLRPADPQAERLGADIMSAASGCVPPNVQPCVRRAFEFLDARYEGDSVRGTR